MQCIDYINRTIKLKRLTPLDLAFFAMHSPEEIMHRKKAFVAFPCLDLSIVGAELLVRNGIKSQIIIEQRVAPNQMEVHHYSLALTLGEKPMQIKVGRGLHLSEEPIHLRPHSIQLRTPKGKKIEGQASPKLIIDYSVSRAHEPAFNVLGFSSRRNLRLSMNWTLPIALRNLLAYNSSRFARRIVREKNMPILSHATKLSMGTRMMLALKRARERFRRKRSK
jgi:hypothetical protein